MKIVVRSFWYAVIMQTKWFRKRTTPPPKSFSHLCVITHRTPSFTVLGIELSYIGQDCFQIPSILGNAYGKQTKRLDVSFNSLRSLDGLERFPFVEEIVLDNNHLDDSVRFPHNEYLHTLSINKNKIRNLDRLLDQLEHCFPNLTYLSLLGNPACPDQLSSTDKDEEDYYRYRCYVIHRLSKLKFLDSSPVKASEKRDAAAKGAYMKIIRPSVDEDSEQQAVDCDAIDALSYSPLPSNTAPAGSHRGVYGTLKYRYSGKHSEGNRFIRNNEL